MRVNACTLKAFTALIASFMERWLSRATAWVSPTRLYWASLSLMFNRYIKYSIRSRFRVFVIRSDELSMVPTGCSWKAPSFKAPWIQRSRISTCLSFDKPCLFTTARADDESLKAWLSGVTPVMKPRASFTYIRSTAKETRALSSASQLDIATTRCVRLAV